MDIRQQDQELHRGDIDLSLADAARTVWSARKAVLIVTMVTALIALGVALLMTPVYRAAVIVVPVTSGDTKGLLSGIAGQLGGLALGGLTLPKSQGADEALGVINSRGLISQYIERNDLLPILYPKQWDAKRRVWVASFGKKTPTLWRGTRYFVNNVRTIADDKKTGLITVSVDWHDPDLAAKWANGIVTLANDELRDRAIAESERDIDYLNEQLAKTNIIELRTSIYQLMEEEIKKAMVARGSGEFAFRTVDTAVAPQEKSSPRRLLMTAVGALVGFLLSAFYAIRGEYFRKPVVPNV